MKFDFFLSITQLHHAVHFTSYYACYRQTCHDHVDGVVIIQLLTTLNIIQYHKRDFVSVITSKIRIEMREYSDCWLMLDVFLNNDIYEMHSQRYPLHEKRNETLLSMQILFTQCTSGNSVIRAANYSTLHCFERHLEVSSTRLRPARYTV